MHGMSVEVICLTAIGYNFAHYDLGINQLSQSWGPAPPPFSQVGGPCPLASISTPLMPHDLINVRFLPKGFKVVINELGIRIWSRSSITTYIHEDYHIVSECSV